MLERRVLLAHVGLDVNFADGGPAPVGGDVMIAQVSSGKILVVDSSKASRLNNDGSIDGSFRDQGADNAAASEERNTSAFLIGPRVIMVGQKGNVGVVPIFLRAIDTNGAVDSTFGTDGTFTFTPPSVVAGATLFGFVISSSVATSDGGIIIGVDQNLRDAQGEFQADAIYKVNAAGQLDSGFGDNGVVVLNDTAREGTYPDLANAPGGNFLVLEDAGRFVLDGNSVTLSRITHFHSDGTMDSTFGTNGVVQLDTLIPSGALFPDYAISSVQDDGKILVEVDDAEDLETLGNLGRLNADGTLDTSFGTGGVIHLGAGNTLRGHTAIDADGNIIGSMNSGELIRLSPSGQFDTSFDDDGIVLLRRPDEMGNINAAVPLSIAIDSDGRILSSVDGHVERFIERERVVLGSDDIVHIDGTDAADALSASLSGDSVNVSLNGETSTFAAGSVVGLSINDPGGNLSASIALDLPVMLIGGDGNDSISTAGGGDRLYCGAGDDTVTAGAGKDIIFGGFGDDQLDGGDGDDRILGESGADSISGGAGNDWLFGGSPFHPTADDSVYADGADSIAGGDGRDRLFGNEGNDALAGNAGPDRLDGGTGADLLSGNGSSDQLLGGGGSDHLHGGACRDWLYGQGGDDLILGNSGNDHLNGGAGADVLHGNGGTDEFVSNDGLIDSLFGDGGRDSSVADSADVLASIESAVTVTA
jgi:uncharacterized delta-60 repeat protein